MSRPGVLATLVPLILAIACAGPVPTGSRPPPPPDVGGTWTVVRIGDLSTVPAAEPRVTFPDAGARIEVVTGCSELRGRVAIAGDRIAITELRPSAIGPCAAAERDVEIRLGALFGAAERIAGAPGRLHIAAGQVDALLVRGDLDLHDDEAALAGRLEESPWRLTTLAGAPVSDGLPPAAFAEGTFVALGLCGYTGRYRLVGEDLVRIAEIGWDAGGGCAPADERLREDLSTTLEAADRIVFDAFGRLVLSGRAGEAMFEAE